jgi:large subunit ribosomal protein L10
LSWEKIFLLKYEEYMSKTKQQKNEMMSLLENQLTETKNFCVVEYQGLTVKDMDDLRKKMKVLNASLHVINNRILKKLLEKMSAGEGLGDLTKFGGSLAGPSAVIFERGDQVKTLKQLLAFSKTNEKLKVKACYFDTTYFAGGDIKKLASLGTKEEVLSTLVGMISSPMRRMATVLSAPTRNFLIVLQAAQKKQ